MSNLSERRLASASFDLAVAVGVVLLAVSEQVPAIVLPHSGAMAVVLLWRRRWPTPVFAVVAALAALTLWWPTSSTIPWYDVAVLVAMYSVVKYAPRQLDGVLAGAATLLGALLAGLVDDADNWYMTSALIGLTSVGVWFAALYMRTRRLHVLGLEERMAIAERERDQLARIAVAEERARIAREMHDVVAHSLAVMISQADGASYMVDRDSTRVRNALRVVGTTGREALAEMRVVLGMLRAGDGAPSVERPRAALGQIETLVALAREAGLRVTVAVDGVDTVDPPAGVELAAYRIVQESLTNVIKYAPGARTRLLLRCAAHAIEIRVVNDRAERPTTSSKLGGGHGLVGMRERVAMYGGDFRAGPRFDGGWQVEARIPVSNGSRASSLEQLEDA